MRGFVQRARRSTTVLIWLVFLLLVNCLPALGAGHFAKTYRELALTKTELPEVVAGHPRLYLRQQPWSHGPSLVELRRWAEEAPLQNYLRGKAWDRQPRLEWAFRYLVTGDESLVPPIVAWMKKQKGYWPGYLLTLATLYDWIYPSPSFSAADKRVIEDKLVSWGRAAIYKGEQYGDMWSHFGYGPVTDLAAAGLALHGHRDEASEFLAMAGGYLEKVLLPGWQLNDGVWLGGWAYYAQGPAKLMILIHLWSSATTDNLYQRITDEQGDWLRNHLHFLLGGNYGKTGPLEMAGFSYTPHIKGLLEGALPIVYAYQDPAGIAYFTYLKEMPWWADIWQFLFYSPQMHRQQQVSDTRPLAQLWGRNGAGYARLRSGYEQNDTLIEFKCGDYFWSHQFHNQNAFTVYHGGELALQSGIYDAYWGPHMQFYYRPTISSNTMLVIQPGETRWIPPGVANNNGVPNEDGYFSAFGGQRNCYMHPDYGSAENCFSFDKYLYRKDHQHHFETGTMQAWEVGERYTYASGDATMAYNNPRFSYPDNTPKLDHASRDLVFLDNRYLLVFDRVNALDPGYEKRWLLHTINRPQIGRKKISEEVPGHIASYDAGRLRIDNGMGSMFVETIYPQPGRLRLIGGAPSMSTVKMGRQNRGNVALQTEVAGKYAGMGGRIATDAAQAEEWIIEFMSDKSFRVSGSKTGNDGQGRIDKLFLSKSAALLIPPENWKGNAEKGDKLTFSTISQSYRFWANGRQNLPKVKKLYQIFKDGSKVHPGNWRIEVSPIKEQNYDSFLHILTIGDHDSVQAAVASGLRSADGRLTGLQVEDWLVMFVELSGLGQDSSYWVEQNGKIDHLILGLKKDTLFAVDFDADTGQSQQLQLRSSSEGTMHFSSEVSTRVTIRSL